MDLFKSKNEAQYRIENGQLTVTAIPYCDYFVNPVDGAVETNAPFVYRELTGDFTLRAQVSLQFHTIADACALLAFSHDRLWVKACFERTDFGANAMVSVVTNGYSDDANGVNLTGDTLWMQLARKGDLFGIHYSLDGQHWIMARLCRLAMPSTIEVGFVAQSPCGEGGPRHFSCCTFTHRAPENIRSGI